MNVLAAAHSVIFPIAHTLALAACGFVPWVLCKHAGAVRDSPRLWFLAEPAAVIAGYFGAKYILSMTALSRTFDFPEVVIYRAGVFALVTAIGLFLLTPVLLDRGLIGKPTAVEHPRRWPRHGILRTDGRERPVADD